MNGDDDQNDPGNTGASDPPAPGNPTTLTQDQLDQLVQARVAQAQRGATNALLKELGFANKAELDRFVKQTKEAERAQMTEAERLAAEAKEQLEAAKAEREAYTARSHALAVREALIEAGMPPAKAAKAVRLVDAEPGAEADAIAAAVEAVKGEMPELFGSDQPPTKPKPTSSEPTAGGPPPQRNQGQTAWERGKARAAARNAAIAASQGTPTP